MRSMIFGYAYFLRAVYLQRPLQRFRRALANGMLVVVILSSIATLSSTISVIPISGPALLPGYKQFWRERFRLINSNLDRIIDRAAVDGG